MVISCTQEDSTSEVTTIESVECAKLGDLCENSPFDLNRSIRFKPAFSIQEFNFSIDKNPDFIKDLEIIAPKIKDTSKIVLTDKSQKIVTIFDSLEDLEKIDFNLEEEEKEFRAYFLTFSGKINGLEINKPIKSITGDIILYLRPIEINITTTEIL